MDDLLVDGCREGDLAVVQQHFTREALEARTASGRSLVHIAAQNGHLEVTRWLLEQGASLATVGDDGQTPLIDYVGMHCELAMAELLVEGGVPIDATNADGWTALAFACHRDARWNPLVSFLLDRGADANARTREGWTPYLLACHKRVVVDGPSSVLLAREDVEVDIAGAVFGFTPLMMAVRGMPLPVVEALVARGADPDARMAIAAGPHPRPVASELARNLYRELRVAATYDGFTARAWAAKGPRKTKLAAILANRPPTRVLR